MKFLVYSSTRFNVSKVHLLQVAVSSLARGREQSGPDFLPRESIFWSMLRSILFTPYVLDFTIFFVYLHKHLRTIDIVEFRVLCPIKGFMIFVGGEATTNREAFFVFVPFIDSAYSGLAAMFTKYHSIYIKLNCHIAGVYLG